MYIGSFMSKILFPWMVLLYCVINGGKIDWIINSVKFFNDGGWETVAVLSRKTVFEIRDHFWQLKSLRKAFSFQEVFNLQKIDNTRNILILLYLITVLAPGFHLKEKCFLLTLPLFLQQINKDYDYDSQLFAHCYIFDGLFL